jgi:hypothetical protein
MDGDDGGGGDLTHVMNSLSYFILGNGFKEEIMMIKCNLGIN